MTAPRRAAFAALVLAAALSTAAAAAALSLDGALTQGGLVLGRTEPGARVRLDGRAVRVAPDGLFVIGFGRDAAAAARLEVETRDGASLRRVLAITPRIYATQRIDGLPPGMVTPSAEQLERIRREGRLIAAVRRRDTASSGFAGGFRWPVAGVVTGVYGSQRILNGAPRRPHFGIDIAAAPDTSVAAAAPGTVALAERDLFFTGGTVMIDHGHGITSVYSHLSRVDVSVGAQVGAGDVIGVVGATGRVTGAHLDWRVSWFATPLDPALLAGPMAAPEVTRRRPLSPASGGGATATAPGTRESTAPPAR